METLTNIWNSPLFNENKNNFSNLQIGDTVKIVIFLELPNALTGVKKKKEKLQIYEGVIILIHKNTPRTNSTMTVRKMFPGGATEKNFVLSSPWIKEILFLSRAKVRRAKLYYLRKRQGKAARLKTFY